MQPIIAMTYFEWFRKHSDLGETTHCSDHFHTLRSIIRQVYGKESGVANRLLVTAERGDGWSLEPMYALQLGDTDPVLVRLCCVGGRNLWVVTVISLYNVELSSEIQATCSMQEDLSITNRIDDWGLQGPYCRDKSTFSFMASASSLEIFLRELKARV